MSWRGPVTTSRTSNAGSSALYQGRDLRPTLELRSVMKGVLAQHLGVAKSVLEEWVFPETRGARLLEGLVKTRA